jgi:hypothetical protein
MDRCGRECRLSCLHQRDETSPIEQRLAAGESYRGRLGRQQREALPDFVDDPTVIYIFGRLGAHQASMAASVGDEEGVVSRSLSPKDTIPLGRRLDRYHVAGA